MAKVLLTAEHHNWGLCTADDWHQTNYILYDDGMLHEEAFVGREKMATERHLNEVEMAFIKKNAKKYVLAMPEIDACDGSVWKYDGPDFSFDLGYIYGTDLEKIADILENANQDSTANPIVR